MTPDARRARRVAERSIADLNLDLSGLVVYTEAASGNYAFTPLLAALAGAERVFAVTCSSRYGSREEVRDLTAAMAGLWNVAGRVQVRFEKTEDDIASSDIVTNTGFVRPLDRGLIAWMKRTAVIPLMWETWEFRAAELDLSACHDRGILVLGTREDRVPHSMYPYCGFAALKLLFELGIEGYRARVVLLGGGILGTAIKETFDRLGITTEWFSGTDRSSRSYSELRAFWAQEGPACDALVLAELTTHSPIIGRYGWLTVSELTSGNPDVRIGVMAGQSDFEALHAAGVSVFPAEPRPPGCMSYHPDALGPRPVLELYAAGLKVAEAMARARLSGLTLDESRRFALAHSPAMDFAEHP